MRNRNFQRLVAEAPCDSTSLVRAALMRFILPADPPAAAQDTAIRNLPDFARTNITAFNPGGRGPGVRECRDGRTAPSGMEAAVTFAFFSDSLRPQPGKNAAAVGPASVALGQARR